MIGAKHGPSLSHRLCRLAVTPDTTNDFMIWLAQILFHNQATMCK
jgi:hypothetical protein